MTQAERDVAERDYESRKEDIHIHHQYTSGTAFRARCRRSTEVLT